MNLKKTLLTSAILLLSTSDSDNVATTKLNENIFNVLIDSPKENIEESVEKPVYYKFDLSKELLETIDSMSFDESWSTVFTRYLDDLKNTPLFMKWTKRHLGEFLWYTQYDSIVSKYNQDSLKTKVINDLESLAFPLIYDDLKWQFPVDLSEILLEEKFMKYENDLDSVKNLIIVTSLEDGNYVLGYYVDSKLFLASHCSIGRWKSTPKWLFDIKRKIFDKRSFKYENAPMPYSLHLDWNIFIHQWYSDWTKRSKGCVRLPWLYQEVLYYHSDIWTKVLIEF